MNFKTEIENPMVREERTPLPPKDTASVWDDIELTTQAERDDLNAKLLAEFKLKMEAQNDQRIARTA